MSNLAVPDADLEASSEITPLKLKSSSSDQSNSIPPIPFAKLFEGTSSETNVLLVIGIISASACGVIYAVIFYFLGQLYDEDMDEEEDDYDMYHETCKIAFIWSMLGFAITIAGLVACYCFMRVSQDAGKVIRTRYFHAILGKDISYFDGHNVAELPTKMNHECALIEGGTGEKFMIFVEIAVYVLVGFAIVFEKSPELLLVGLALAPLNVLGSLLFGFGYFRGITVEQEAYIKAGAISEEALTDVKTVASFNAQEYINEKYSKALEAPMKVVSKMGMIKGIGFGISWFTWMITGGVIFWASAKWVCDERKVWIWRDVLEGPDAIVCFWIIVFTSTRLGHLVPGIAAFLEAMAAGGQAHYFINKANTFVNGTRKQSIEGTIEFKNVTFEYLKQSDKQVLKGLSFVCEKGQKTAIVGESGAGKSTIIQLMERFYEPSSGLILFDGVPVTEFDIGYLRKQVGYVSQEPVLFNLTIEENILLGNPSASSEEVEAAAKEANAYGFILLLQDGFLTNVGARGSKLSGGQKQRIAIARAMVKKPKILLLDEATSALDNQSEEIVLRALNGIHSRQEVTMISVAQKLSTIRNADKIVVLRDGKVEEEGTHGELISKGSLYTSMCAAQSSDLGEVMIQMQEMISEKFVESSTTKEEGESRNNAKDSSRSLRSFPLLRLFKPMLSHWVLITVGSISACGCGLMFPALGFCLGKMITYIDGRAGDEMEDNIRKYAIWMFFLGIITFISFFLMQWSLNLISALLTKDLRERTFQKMLHLDASFFDSKANNPNMLTQNLNHDIRKVNDASGPLLGSFIFVIVAFVAGEAIGIYWQWRLGLVMLAIIPIQSFAQYRGYLIRSVGISHPKYQSSATLALDSILNVKTLRAYEMQTMMERKYSECLDSMYKETKVEVAWSGISYGMSLGMVFWGLSIAFWYAGYLKMKDQAGVEDCNVAIFSTYMTIIGIAASAATAPGVAEGSQAATRIYQLVDYEPKINSMETTGITTEIRGLVNFNNVEFKYQGRENVVLHSITFEIPIGKHIGITGASGSGKTTITQLLLRFYDPTEGTISIDGVDICQYNIRHLRASIAMVGQEPVLFSGTVRSNVDFGLGKSDEDIKQALIRASIPRFAEELDKEVGSRGSLVSGGQKQRIAIARAILRSPKILVLDEATSALDTKTEKKILSALEYAGQGRTVLVIAHRLSTIEKCDEIFVMDAGQIKERGTHEELMHKEGSIYQKLLAAANH